LQNKIKNLNFGKAITFSSPTTRYAALNCWYTSTKG